MPGEESVSVLIHADTVSFFFFFSIIFLTFGLGKLQVKNCFKRPLKLVLVTAVVTLWTVCPAPVVLVHSRLHLSYL